VHQDDGVVCPRNDARLGRDALRDLVRVVRGGQPRSRHRGNCRMPRLVHQVAHRPGQERPVVPGPGREPGERSHRLLGGFPVRGDSCPSRPEGSRKIRAWRATVVSSCCAGPVMRPGLSARPWRPAPRRAESRWTNRCGVRYICLVTHRSAQPGPRDLPDERHAACPRPTPASSAAWRPWSPEAPRASGLATARLLAVAGRAGGDPRSRHARPDRRRACGRSSPT